MVEETSVRREARGLMGLVGQGGERKSASSERNNDGNTVQSKLSVPECWFIIEGIQWKPRSAIIGGVGRSGGITSLGSTCDRVVY